MTIYASVWTALFSNIVFSMYVHINIRKIDSSINLVATLKVCIGGDVVLLAC